MTYLAGKMIKLVKFTDRFVTPKYIEWLNDQEVNKFLFTGRIPISKEEITNRNDYCNIMFAIMTNLLPDDVGCLFPSETYSAYIGTISLNSIEWINRKGEIGYMIGEKKYWGCGIATEAVELISNYALQRLNLHKVEAGVVEGNIGSVRVLEKNGFKQYGVIPQDYWHDGEFRDALRFYKLQEW